MQKLSPALKLQYERRVRQLKESERIRLCVILSYYEGVSAELIAQTHRISVMSVYRYVREYENEEKLRDEKVGGSVSKLNEEETEELKEHLEKTTYLYAKDICRCVKEKYRVDYSVAGMIFWLKEHGFEYKKPINVPGKIDPEQQELFIKKYEKLKKQIGKDEEIYFLDAVHPAFQSQRMCGWIKKGTTKTLLTTNKQSRLHFIGAIRLQHMQVIAQEYATVNAETMIAFLRNLERISKATKIHVICDNGRANKNKCLQAYVESSRIHMHYLPPYSPNLNPIERLWKVLREQKTYNKCYKNFAEFTENIRQFFEVDLVKLKVKLTKRINDKFQRIQLNNIVLGST